mmetsp:Transcript_39540/g.47978  ORF Transcript_39540/g.47978 Transcript_39540/m.47978 type:complete len:224 (-) Transcript_39540:573-1244(-)
MPLGAYVQVHFITVCCLHPFVSIIVAIALRLLILYIIPIRFLHGISSSLSLPNPILVVKAHVHPRMEQFPQQLMPHTLQEVCKFHTGRPTCFPHFNPVAHAQVEDLPMMELGSKHNLFPSSFHAFHIPAPTKHHLSHQCHAPVLVSSCFACTSRHASDGHTPPFKQCQNTYTIFLSIKAGCISILQIRDLPGIFIPSCHDIVASLSIPFSQCKGPLLFLQCSP